MNWYKLAQLQELQKSQEDFLSLFKPQSLRGLAAEAIKCDSFTEFEKDFLQEIKHGTYWHVTENPNFTIDSERGPRDMSSLAISNEDKGKIATSNWVYHNTKKEFLDEIKQRGLEAGSFSTQPIDFGGDVWLAVDRNILPERTQEHQYGDATAIEPAYEETEYEDAFVINPDLIYMADNKGKILGKLNQEDENQEDETNSIEKEAKKYKTLKDFENDYEILYHGGSENIIGDKLSLGGRLPGEITEENLGTGQDYGGIFFTPEIEFAKTFAGHSSSGIGKVHTFAVRKNNLFDESNINHARRLENFIGHNYIDVDGETVEFTRQMYDFIFPKLTDGKRHMDWGTFDPQILEAMGFEGAKVIENYDAYGTGKHLYTTVLFNGGKESPHWKLKDNQTLSDIYNGATTAKNQSWYKRASEYIKNKSPYPNLKVEEYYGIEGKRDHMTRDERGMIPPEAIAHIQGGAGEIRGQHRNKRGQAWELFKQNLKENGMKNPITIFKFPGENPVIWEGNHRLDAALELGLKEVPVDIRYWGKTETEGLVYK